MGDVVDLTTLLGPLSLRRIIFCSLIPRSSALTLSWLPDGPPGCGPRSASVSGLCRGPSFPRWALLPRAMEARWPGPHIAWMGKWVSPACLFYALPVELCLSVSAWFKENLKAPLFICTFLNSLFLFSQTLAGNLSS